MRAQYIREPSARDRGGWRSSSVVRNDMGIYSHRSVTVLLLLRIDG